MSPFARTVFGMFCLALLVLGCCLTSSIAVADSALAAVLTFSLGGLLLWMCMVSRQVLREVAVGIEMAAIVPAAGGRPVGVPLGAAAADALPAAAVAPGALVGWNRVVLGRMIEV
jgi:hypothetical protein